MLDLADEFDAGLLLERLARSVTVENLLALGIELRILLGVESVDLPLLAIGPSTVRLARAVCEVAVPTILGTLIGPTGPVAGAVSGAAGAGFCFVAVLAHRLLGVLEPLQLILDVFEFL